MNVKKYIRNFVIFVSVLALYYLYLFNISNLVFASSTSNFTQTINAGSLGVDIVDSGLTTVGSPVVAMGAETFSFSCATSSGTFGTASEQIYVTNPDAADNGWSVTLAAAAPTTLWDSAGTDFDFNDGEGCLDGGDGDSFAGQMIVDPSGGSIDVGNCSSCTTTGVTAGSSDAFVQGTTDSITILQGASGSDDVGDWTLQGVSISQTIPGEQPAAADYDIDLTLSIAAI